MGQSIPIKLWDNVELDAFAGLTYLITLVSRIHLHHIILLNPPTDSIDPFKFKRRGYILRLEHSRREEGRGENECRERKGRHNASR